MSRRRDCIGMVAVALCAATVGCPSSITERASERETLDVTPRRMPRARDLFASHLSFAKPRWGLFDFPIPSTSTSTEPVAPFDAGAFAPDAELPDAQPSPADAAPEQPDAAGACPIGMVLVEGDSCSDVVHTCLSPVPNDPARRCLEFKSGPGADICVPPIKKLRYCMDRYEWPGQPGVQPRVLVDYFEAEKLCQSVGKRMCDEDEFYLACEGPQHWPFAWGHVRHPSPCNIDRPYTMVDWVKWSKGEAAMYEEAKRLDQALPIGSSKCWSPYGIHDIAGNADEWTKARPGRDFEGSLNGGYWGPVANACRYVTLVHGPEFKFYQIGFRCCSNAK